MPSSTLITDYLGEGTHADRPASPPVPTGGIGIYFETDTQQTFVFDKAGSQWVAIASGGGGGGGGGGTSDFMRNLDYRPGNPGKAQTAKLEYVPVASGATQVLLDYTGKGHINDLYLALPRGDGYQAYERSTIRIFFDGESTPSVNCTLCRFFAADYNVNAFQTRYLGACTATGVWYRCSFPMPFNTHVRVELQANAGISELWSMIRYNVDDTISWGRYSRFKAYETVNSAVAPYSTVNLVDHSAKGVLCGVYMLMDGGGNGYGYLEGNVSMYIDGATSPTVDSSGTEDYFQNGFYFAGGLVCSDHVGCTHMGTSNDVGAYRIHNLDPITYDTELKITWQCGTSGQGSGQYSNVYMVSVVWLYEGTD